MGLSAAGRFARLLPPTEYKLPTSAYTMHTCPNPFPFTFSLKSHSRTIDYEDLAWIIFWAHWVGRLALAGGGRGGLIGFKFCDLCQVRR